MVDNFQQTLVLPGETNSFVMETNGDNWAKCFLSGTPRIYLGADDFSVIAARLRDFLMSGNTRNEPADGEINGFPVVWLLSLTESPHCLYGAISGEDYCLFWQNADQLTIVGTMRLSQKQRRQWTEKLTSALNAYREPALAGHSAAKFS